MRFLFSMKLVVIFASLFSYAYLYDMCDQQENLCSEERGSESCKVKSLLGSEACSQVSFSINEKQKNSIADIILEASYDSMSQFHVNITFSNVKWIKAYLKISDENNKKQYVCKIYTIEKNLKLPVNSPLVDSCFWNSAKKLKAKTYLLQYKVESKAILMYRKILFDVPDLTYFDDSVSVTKRLIFAYIDFTSNNELILKIQPLPTSYNVTHYKIETFRERKKNHVLLDVRLMAPSKKQMLHFEYLTFNEEGFYYFAISVISDKCPEDSCKKTITSKLYISRKGTPLVIGIVGASFIIPFVLFIFHMWNHRFKNSSPPEAVEKILILFKPSTEKHNDVVMALSKTIKNLTGIEVMTDPVNLTKNKEKDVEKWCSDNLILASHIIYISPPSGDENNCELDYMTYNFLKEETKKSIPEKDIIILNLPYCTKDVPSILVNCIKFELMDDFQRFIYILQPTATDFNYENNINCMELMNKIKLAQEETDKLKNSETPRIVITDQSELAEEPKEIDVLL